MNKKEENKLSMLKKGHSDYPSSPNKARLETFDNPSPDVGYTVEFESQEFTSLCPVTSQPDFAGIKITYGPDKKCIESKSLKLYLFSYRNTPGFAEDLVNRILKDLSAACRPKWMEIEADFAPRGGISIKVKSKIPDKKEGKQSKSPQD